MSGRRTMSSKATTFLAAACTGTLLLLGVMSGDAMAGEANQGANPPARTTATPARPGGTRVSNETIARGRYLVNVAGCNDCHTDGFAERAGKVPEADWLTGTQIGFKGPWGISYPANLRLSASAMNEAQWMALARAERLPPMPWYVMRDMTDEDLRAIYHYIRSLGPKGQPAPRAVPPGAPSTTPYYIFEPQTDRPAAARTRP